MGDLPLAAHLSVYAAVVATVLEPKSSTYTYAGPLQFPQEVYSPNDGGVGGDVSASMNAARHDTVLEDRAPEPTLSYEKEVPDCEADMNQ